MISHKIAIQICGFVFLMATIIHGVWHWYILDMAAFEALESVPLETVLLFNAGVTLCLFFLALITLFLGFSDALNAKGYQVFALLLIAFWLSRFGLEFLMPVPIPMLFIEQAGMMVKIISLIPVAIVGLSFITNNRAAQQSSKLIT